MGAARRSWVSKTDIARYARCPFGFWALEEGLVSEAEAFTPRERELLADGVAFHERVEAQAQPLEPGWELEAAGRARSARSSAFPRCATPPSDCAGGPTA